VQTFLVIAAGGALGAMSRYGVNLAAARWLGLGFPWGTLIVNIVGCLILGALIELLALRSELPQAWRSFLGTGFCGALTTFSAFSADVVLMWERGALVPAAAYLLCSLVLAIGAFVAGLYLLRAVL